ncbi:MAG: hypothetical protein ACRDZX_03785, partial [Acidimicrobiales bacterium]
TGARAGPRAAGSVRGTRRGRSRQPGGDVSTKIWYCASCGYEVDSRGRCHSCGQRLIPSPLPELESGPDDDEVGYRLDQWDDQTRARLIRSLVSAKVLHRFEEDDLVILAADEAEVDKMVARATGNLQEDDDDIWGADEDHRRTAPGDVSASRDLYEAARRLRDDPTDMQADVALGEASAALFTVDYLPGLDDAGMAAVGRVTRRLLGALGADEALEQEISHEAEVLCRLVAPSAGQEQGDAEAGRASARLEKGARDRGRLVALPQSVVTPGGEVAGTPSEEPALAAAGEVGVEEVRAGEVGAGGGEVGAGEGEVDLEEEEEEEEDGTGELVYELAEWLPEQRVELSMVLEAAGIAYNWDSTDLTVAEEHEREVDGLFEQVRGLVDEDDEARYHRIEELFGAVDRLANDPSNEERQHAFLDAVGAVELPTPVGVDDTFWWRVRSQGHVLVGALEHDARVDEISREAALLAEMLHEMV